MARLDLNPDLYDSKDGNPLLSGIGSQVSATVLGVCSKSELAKFAFVEKVAP